MDCTWCEDPSAKCSEHVLKGSYTVNRTVEVTIKFPKKRLLEIFASDECWSEDGQRFNKIRAIQIFRDDEFFQDGRVGLKDAKYLIDDFMQSVFGAIRHEDIK